MKQLITLNINGEQHELALSPDTTLLKALRQELGMLGTKRGCDTSACGCCTVHLDGKAVYSCVVYAAAVQDCEITTIAGGFCGGRSGAVWFLYLRDDHERQAIVGRAGPPR